MCTRGLVENRIGEVKPIRNVIGVGVRGLGEPCGILTVREVEGSVGYGGLVVHSVEETRFGGWMWRSDVRIPLMSISTRGLVLVAFTMYSV